MHEPRMKQWNSNNLTTHAFMFIGGSTIHAVYGRLIGTMKHAYILPGIIKLPQNVYWPHGPFSRLFITWYSFLYAINRDDDPYSP